MKIQFLYILGGIGVSLFLYLLLVLFLSPERRVKVRLDHIRGETIMQNEEDDVYNKSFMERVLQPIYNAVFKVIAKLAPENINKEYELSLLQAGMLGDHTPARLLTNQLLLMTFNVIGSALISHYAMGKINFLMLAFAGISSFYLPLYRVRQKAKKRQGQIQKDLTNLLDMIYISVEAGLSFDMAMKKTAAKMEGPLSYEITRAMEDVSKGRNRIEALRSIGIRTQVDDVKTFIATVIQSELLGSNIANVLRIQSKDLRNKRAQRTEELAMKIPIKMLFPLIFFLFPSLFIVIMGPAVINVIRTFPEF